MTGDGAISEATLGRLHGISQRSLRRASESLTGLLGHPVRLAVSSIHAMPVSDLPGLASEAADVRMVGLRFEITGEAAGQIILLFPLHTIFRILRVLLGAPEEERSLSNQERSAVQEVGNILVGSFLSGLGDLLRKRLVPSPPEIHLDDFPGLIRRVRAHLNVEPPEVLVVQALFEDPEQRIEGRFFVLPEMASLAAMLHQADAGGGTGA